MINKNKREFKKQEDRFKDFRFLLRITKEMLLGKSRWGHLEYSQGVWVLVEHLEMLKLKLNNLVEIKMVWFAIQKSLFLKSSHIMILSFWLVMEYLRICHQTRRLKACGKKLIDLKATKQTRFVLKLLKNY